MTQAEMSQDPPLILTAVATAELPPRGMRVFCYRCLATGTIQTKKIVSLSVLASFMATVTCPVCRCNELGVLPGGDQ
jgi:hypothetical protein